MPDGELPMFQVFMLQKAISEAYFMVYEKGSALTMKRRTKLARILRRNKSGKLIVIRGTEHCYYVSQALRGALEIYCNVKNTYCGPLEPPVCAMKDADSPYWQTANAQRYVHELARLLDKHSPYGWHFHIPIFGIVLEYGWFRNYYTGNNLE